MAAAFPKAIFSSDFLKSDGHDWTILRLGITINAPMWSRVSQVLHRGPFIFREIGYLEEGSKVVGIGRIWVPISRIGVQVARKSTLKLIDSAPVGVAVEAVVEQEGSIVDYEVIRNQVCQCTLSPYWIVSRETRWVQRLLMARSGTDDQQRRLLAIAEEKLVNDLCEKVTGVTPSA